MESSGNNFGLMTGRSTIEAIFTLRQMTGKYREAQEDLSAVFINLEKAYV